MNHDYLFGKNFEKVCKCTDLNDRIVMAWLVQSISKTAGVSET